MKEVTILTLADILNLGNGDKFTLLLNNKLLGASVMVFTVQKILSSAVANGNE